MNRKGFLINLLDAMGLNVVNYNTYGYGNGGKITLAGFGPMWFFNDKTSNGYSLKFKPNEKIFQELLARRIDIEEFMALLGIEFKMDTYRGSGWYSGGRNSTRVLRIRFKETPWNNFNY